jgi:hypothetical protein
VQPIFEAIELIASPSDPYSPQCSKTIRTARSRTSDEYVLPFRFVIMAPISQELEPPAIPEFNTVDAAYHELAMQGWLIAEPSRGTFVATDLPDMALHPQPARPISKTTTPLRPVERVLLRLSDGSPDVRLVPTTAFAQAFRRALASAAFTSGGSYGDPCGNGKLREALSSYLGGE